MRKIWERSILFINKNIGRKLTCMMVPVMCIIMSVTIILVNHIYMERFVKNIEEDTQYITDTFKLNMDFCTTDVKSFLNTLSINEHVKYLVTMDRSSMDYAKFLESQREIKRQLGSMAALKSYVQDVIIAGSNGYQYNYLTALKGSIIDTEWFRDSVDTEKKGFQYILPHEVDYYERGRSLSGKAISIVLPIQSEGACEGYVICDISMEKAAVLPSTVDKNTSMKTYLVNGSTKEYYDFQAGKNHAGNDAEFIKYLGEKERDFQIADQDFIVYSKMESSDWYIVAVYIYRDIIASAVAAQRIGIIMLFISCAAVGILSYMISRSFRKPIDELLHRIHQVEEENFKPMEAVLFQNQPGEIIQIRNSFEKMTRRIDDLVHKVYLDEIYQKNMEYENLVNQVNPHFIYNVLQLIQAKAVLNENYEIDDIVVALSRLMRYTMSNKDKIVTVKEECSYIESYLELYEQRYSHKFSYEISLEKELEPYPVLKFIMQPVVENCIKHGFKSLKREGYVKIRIFKNSGRVYFETEDNGNGIPAHKLKELLAYMEDTEDKKFDSIGLKNTYQRLKLTYGAEAGMQIESVEDTYTRVCCFIPYKEG